MNILKGAIGKITSFELDNNKMVTSITIQMSKSLGFFIRMQVQHIQLTSLIFLLDRLAISFPFRKGWKWEKIKLLILEEVICILNNIPDGTNCTQNGYQCVQDYDPYVECPENWTFGPLDSEESKYWENEVKRCEPNGSTECHKVTKKWHGSSN